MSRNRLTLFALGLAAGTTALFSLVTINHLKDVVIADSLRGRPIGLNTLLGAVRPEDCILATCAALGLLALVWLEVKSRAVTRLFATASEGEAFALLTILAAWLGHAYLGAGVLLGGDTGSHIARFLEVERGLEAGHLPVWTNYQYLGAPLLWFTGPLTYVVGGAVAFLTQDAVWAAKLLLFVLHMAGGWAFFALLRRFGVRPMPSALAAAAFAGSFAHLHLFLYRGVFPQAFTIVFLVLLFWSADGLLRARGARWLDLAVFALTTAGLIVNHQPHALFAAFYLGLFGAVALASGVWPWRRLPLLVLGGALGGVAAAVAVLPVLVEADWVMIEPDGGLFRFQLPTATRLLHLVLWRNTRTTWGYDYWAYLGLFLLVFGAAGLFGLARRRLRPGAAGFALPAAICLVPCFFLYNPVVRDVMFILFFLGILAGVGLDGLMDRPILAGRALLAAVAVALADLASTAIQPVARTDKEFLVEAGRVLERETPGQRVVQMTVEPDGRVIADIGPGGNPLSYGATVQRIAGNHNMAATRIHNFAVTAAKRAESDLNARGVLSDRTKAMLAALNVGRIVCYSAIANGCPASMQGLSTDPVLGRYLSLAATPAVFSPNLVAAAPPAGLDKPMLWPEAFYGEESRARILAIDGFMRAALDAEGFDPASGTVRAIAVSDRTGTAPDAAPQAGTFRIVRYDVGLDSVAMDVDAPGAGYVQLAHPWFPSTIVVLDGVQVQPLRGAFGLMVVPVPPGMHRIVLEEGWTPIRLASLALSAAGLAGIALAAGTLAWRERRGARQLRPVPAARAVRQDS